MSASASLAPLGLAYEEAEARPVVRQRSRRSYRWLNPAVLIPGAVLVTVALLTALAPWIAPYDPNTLDMRNMLAGPSSDHWLGTDQLGRDVLTRLLYGGRSTLVIASLATIVTVTIGVAIGVISGYFGGKVDLAIAGLLNVLLSLPSLLLTLAILGVMGAGSRSLLIALIGAGWTTHARLIRASVVSLREQLYVEAAVSIGAGSTRILSRHILPNLITSVVVLATLDMGVLMLTVSALSFLGLGVQPPTSDWGTMLNDARPYFSAVPLLVIVPGLTLTFVVLAANMLGDGLRDLADRGRPI
jgi:peptide/nickel transport system permease protein